MQENTNLLINEIVVEDRTIVEARGLGTQPVRSPILWALRRL